MENNTEKIKEKILQVLRSGEKATTDIAWEIKENYWKVFNILEKMRDVDCTILERKTNYYCYWRINTELEAIEVIA